MPTDANPVLAERRGPVLVLTLNRPERLNAWTDALEERYFDHLDAAERDPDVRAIVLTGAGRGFCAGADLDDLAAVGEMGLVPARIRPRARPLSLRKPMVAAINGAAAGLGLVEALYCDVRFATPQAKLTTSFAQRGLIAEYGIAWLLPRVVGLSRALDLLLSGRIVTGAEALAMGLVDRVVDGDELLEAAVGYARGLAEACSPWSMAQIKAQVYAALDADLVAAVADADRRMAVSFAGPDLAEGVRSHLQRRPPAFPGLPPQAGE
ncbi:enoyl-CoA hydratase-related protein [Dactylosporangium sp. CA-092794]|uniref:enoyl-CoA hydratase-related protein n=1 Tax=Dactylosporangium sp. CA-092794 TaxID=3239929 RepID=UPI003D9305D5